MAVARLAYNTLSYHDARDALYYRFNSDKSSYNKAYTGWNTPFAKDILVKGLSKANNSMYMQLINKGSTEQAAITSVMGAHISEYATASYHEAIAECVAREMTGKGNTTSKAVVTELQSRCRKIR